MNADFHSFLLIIGSVCFAMKVCDVKAHKGGGRTVTLVHRSQVLCLGTEAVGNVSALKFCFAYKMDYE